MKITEYYKLSTGYVSGSIPPIFKENHIKPIAALGSDSILIHDGRHNKETIINKSYERLKQLGKNYIGFKIVIAKSIQDIDKGTVIYDNTNTINKTF